MRKRIVIVLIMAVVLLGVVFGFRLLKEKTVQSSSLKKHNVFVPMPVITFLSEKSITSMREDYNKNFLWEDIYKWWSFEQAVTFYKRLKLKYVKIDEVKQTIEVRVYAHSSPNQFIPFRLDFAKQTLSVKDKKGKCKVYAGRG